MGIEYDLQNKQNIFIYMKNDNQWAYIYILIVGSENDAMKDIIFPLCQSRYWNINLNSEIKSKKLDEKAVIFYNNSLKTIIN